jgi:16S rRNA (adenine1518-N6/adenine1519-N6)-dimethyltransferase
MNEPLRHRAKRSLGQNFLTDPNYIRKIVEAAAPEEGESIVEIGPGTGALTESLLAAGARVTAIEFDRDLAEGLRERFDPTGRFTLIERDALKVEICTIALAPIKVAANLPYNISTAILQKLASERGCLSTLVLMFQKEVVDRISAPPGSTERGYLTVVTEASFEVAKLFDVPPSAFRPVPKVTSSVVRLRPKPALAGEDDFFKLVSTAFAAKRKTLSNNLKASYPGYVEMLEAAGIDGKRRAETLSIGEWLALHEAVRAGLS